MGTFKESLASQCFDRERPVYLLKACSRVVQDKNILLKDLQTMKNATISCEYIDMLSLGSYNELASQRDFYSDYEPIQHSKNIELKDIESTVRAGNQICIFAKNVVLSSIDFSKELVVEQRRQKDKEIAKQHAKDIRAALKSANGLIKIDLQRFCEKHNVEFDRPKGLLGSKELQDIAQCLEDTLQKYGIDYRTTESIPSAVFNEAVENAKFVHQQIEQQRVVERTEQALKTLLATEKPLIAAYSLDTYSIGLGHSYDKINHPVWEEAKNVIASIDVIGDPLHKLSYSADHDSQKVLSLKNITVRDVIDMGQGAYAVLTDNAVFIDGNNQEFMQELAKQYSEWATDQGLEIQDIGGKDGMFALMSAHVVQSESGPLAAARNPNVSDEEKYMYASLYCEKHAQEGSGAFHMPSHRVMLIDGNGIERDINFNELYPGAKFTLYSDGMVDMGTNESVNIATIFEVKDVVSIDGKTLVATDRGLVAQVNIAKELNLDIEPKEHTPIIRE